jgi:ribonuclease D
MAKHKNLPRTWILKDFQLKKIAKQSNPKLWLQTETLTEKQIHNFGRVFSRFHEEHEHLSSKSQTMSLKDRHLFEKCHGIIKKKITNIAAKHDIPTEMICNQRQLKSKVLQMIDERRFVGFDGWRGQLLNTPLGDVFKSFENQHFTD